MKATVILILGLIILAAGTLFMLQGSGVVHWPPESFMINQRDWIERGLAVALVGVALILTSRKIRQ